MKKKESNPRLVFCQYCGNRAEFVDSSEVYSRSYGMMYLCRKCDAYVGCHQYSDRPLGTLAKKELRDLRSQVHAVFDPQWKSAVFAKRSKRSEAYAGLAKLLGIDIKICHVGMFDEARCKEALKLLRPP